MPGPGVEFGGVIDEGAIAARWEGMSSTLDERGRRRWCASEARSHGRGGIAAVARVTGISRRTVDRGLRELELELGREEEPLAAGRGGQGLVGRWVRRRRAQIGYTLQKNVKPGEGSDHPDRDAQFQYINDTA